MTNLHFYIAPVSRNDFDQILNKSLILSLKSKEESREGVEGSAPSQAWEPLK